jgi:hypothetical protein
MSGLPAKYAFAQPSDAWYGQLPKLEDFGNDVAKWQQAVKDYAAIANGDPAWQAMPSDADMAAAYAPGWHAAGAGITPPSAGAYDANLLNQEYLMSNQEGVKGPSFALQLDSRNSVRPGEMQAAYDAVNPDTGEPLLLPQVLSYLEDIYGLAPSHQYQPPMIPMNNDPNYVRDEAARRQALIDQYNPAPVGDLGPGNAGGGGLFPPAAGPPQRPGVNDPVRLPSQQVHTMGAQSPGFDLPPDMATAPNPGDQGFLGGAPPPETPSQMALRLHAQYGSTATIDPRYPDWMLRHAPPSGDAIPARARLGF